jgi:integrase
VGETLFRWQATVPVDGSDPKGPKHRVSKGGYLSFKDAKQELNDAMLRVISARPAVGTKRKFSSFSEEWLVSLDIAASTRAGYLKILRAHLNPTFGSRALADIEVSDVKRLYTKLRESGRKDSKDYGGQLSESSVSKIHLVLSAVLESAMDEGLIISNPVKHKSIRAPGQSRRSRAILEGDQVLSRKQLRKLLTWIKDSLEDDLYPLWHLVAETGVRRSEGIAIQWSDIDFETGILSIRRAADTAIARAVKPTKTYRPRAIFLGRETLVLLELYRSNRSVLGASFVHPRAFVFSTINGDLRGPNDVSARWSRLALKARLYMPDLPNITIKGLRHTHATLLLQAGVNPKVVQERLGHSNIATTMDIYSHVTPTIQAEAFEKYEKWMTSALN